MDIRFIPFSYAGSYMAVSYNGENYKGAGNVAGLYVRSIHYITRTPFICRIVPTDAEGEIAITNVIEEPDEVTVETKAGSIRLCFADKDTLLFETDGDALGITFDYHTENFGYEVSYQIPVGNGMAIIANSYKNRCRYMYQVQKGKGSIEQEWNGDSARPMKIKFEPETGGLSISMREIFREWSGAGQEWDYEESRQLAASAFEEFYQSMPTVPKEYEETRRLCAYVNWESIVAPCGFLKHTTMLMSKNWMSKVWSWDHCFNAIALSYNRPAEAWEQFIQMFDHQDESGRIPDSVIDAEVLWNYCKPPIHGWALQKLMKNMKLSSEQLREAYHKLSAWTNWWLNNRDLDHNGICEYIHGNDSGWDNSTAFYAQPPFELPELQAFLVIQMETLELLAEKLNRQEDAALWKERSHAHLDRMLRYCFDENGNPVSRRAYSGEIIPNNSLILYLPIILGERLPEEVREKIVGVLKSNRFLTEWGYATESPASDMYTPDGYWRGPIWAPSTMLILDGLAACGETELVKKTAKRFADMVSKSGAAENFDALTGEGLCDRAYTWTSSVFMILCHEYLL